jgi:hypothetical protein
MSFAEGVDFEFSIPEKPGDTYAINEEMLNMTWTLV